MLVNLISNIVLYNFTIRLRNFYLNRYFTQLLNANRDNLVIATLFSIQLLLLIILFLCAILFKLINSNSIVYTIS